MPRGKDNKWGTGEKRRLAIKGSLDLHRQLTYSAILGTAAKGVTLVNQKAPVVGAIYSDLSHLFRGDDDGDGPNADTGEGFGSGSTAATGGGTSEFVLHGVDVVLFSAIAFGLFQLYRAYQRRSPEGGLVET